MDSTQIPDGGAIDQTVLGESYQVPDGYAIDETGVDPAEQTRYFLVLT